MIALAEPNMVRLHEPQTVCKSGNNPFMDKKIRAVLARNLASLMAKSEKYNTNNKLSAGTGLGLGTINRVRNQETAASIETVETIAQRFGLSASQLLDESLFAPAAPTVSDNIATYTTEQTADWLDQLIKAAKTAHLKGSLPPNTVTGLIGLIQSLSPVPPSSEQMGTDSKEPKKAAQRLRKAGNPT